jgi:hypothetical protein
MNVSFEWLKYPMHIFSFFKNVSSLMNDLVNWFTNCSFFHPASPESEMHKSTKTIWSSTAKDIPPKSYHDWFSLLNFLSLTRKSLVDFLVPSMRWHKITGISN